MHVLNRTWMAIVMLCAGATVAAAQQPDPAAPAPAPAAEPPPAAAPAPAAAPVGPTVPRKLVGERTVFYTSVGVDESATWTFGMSMPPGVSLAAGIQFNYDGAGLPVGGMRLEDKLSFRSFIYGAYYFYNKFPFAMGFETAIATGLSPTAFDVLTIQPGISLYYAPFPVPVVIGTAIDLQINFPKDGDPIIRSLMPGLRIIYVFALR